MEHILLQLMLQSYITSVDYDTSTVIDEDYGETEAFEDYVVLHLMGLVSQCDPDLLRIRYKGWHVYSAMSDMCNDGPVMIKRKGDYCLWYDRTPDYDLSRTHSFLITDDKGHHCGYPYDYDLAITELEQKQTE